MFTDGRCPMARQSSIQLLAAVGNRRFDDVIRFVAATLVLVAAMAIVSLPMDDKPSSWRASWSTIAASMGSLPVDAEVGARPLDPEEAGRANDDGYLEGLTKALGHDL
jgi:hypothetical protein